MTYTMWGVNGLLLDMPSYDYHSFRLFFLVGKAELIAQTSFGREGDSKRDSSSFTALEYT